MKCAKLEAVFHTFVNLSCTMRSIRLLLARKDQYREDHDEDSDSKDARPYFRLDPCVNRYSSKLNKIFLYFRIQIAPFFLEASFNFIYSLTGPAAHFFRSESLRCCKSTTTCSSVMALANIRRPNTQNSSRRERRTAPKLRS